MLYKILLLLSTLLFAGLGYSESFTAIPYNIGLGASTFALVALLLKGNTNA